MIGRHIRIWNIKYVNPSEHNMISIPRQSNKLLKCKWNIKSRKQEHIGINMLYTTNGIYITPASKAEVLNNTFKSVFTMEDS